MTLNVPVYGDLHNRVVLLQHVIKQIFPSLKPCQIENYFLILQGGQFHSHIQFFVL